MFTVKWPVDLAILFFSNLKTMVRLVIIILILMQSACSTLENASIEISDQHYRIYNGEGMAVDFDQMLGQASQMDVVFIGESHNDPVAHYLENRIFEALADNNSNLVLSMEMLESDIQYILDEYLNDMIREDHFMESTRAWQNYESDYKSLIEFAKENSLPVLAANAPRRYVNLVGREGQQALLALSDEARQFLPPLPYADASEAYAEKFMSLMQGMNPQAGEDAGAEHTVSELSEEEMAEQHEQQERLQRSLGAQSLWDASMAWSISSYLLENPDSSILHVNGNFHSEERLGILDHLRAYRPQTAMLVIAIISSESFPEFDQAEMQQQGDYVIVTDVSMPRTF